MKTHRLMQSNKMAKQISYPSTEHRHKWHVSLQDSCRILVYNMFCLKLHKTPRPIPFSPSKFDTTVMLFICIRIICHCFPKSSVHILLPTRSVWSVRNACTFCNAWKMATNNIPNYWRTSDCMHSWLINVYISTHSHTHNTHTCIDII